MSVLEAPVPGSAPRAVWSQVDDGFYVANRAGEFVGYIDTRADGTFVAFDGTSSMLGEFATLLHAQTSVATAPIALPSPERARADRRGVVAATLAGVVAIGVFGVGAAAGLLY